MTQATKTQKQVQVIARYQIKRNGHVVYTVRSSNGQDTYTTTLVNGKATGCSCPSYKPCYHMVQLEAREAERNESKQQVSTPAAKPVATYIQDGQVHTVECVEGRLVDNVSATDEAHRVSRVDGLTTKWYPEYKDEHDGQWYRYPQPDGNQAVSFVVEGRAEQWLAERLAAVAEQAAEAKMDAFKAAMEVEETRASYMRHFYDEY